MLKYIYICYRTDEEGTLKTAIETDTLLLGGDIDTNKYSSNMHTVSTRLTRFSTMNTRV